MNTRLKPSPMSILRAPLGLNLNLNLGLIALGCLALGVWAPGFAGQTDVPHYRIVKVDSRRFVFIPNQITLKKGETVEFELSSQDVPMGFALPDFALRSDILPGQVSHVQFTPQRTGTYTFLCDVFCGSGHENMDGTITVIE